MTAAPGAAGTVTSVLNDHAFSASSALPEVSRAPVPSLAVYQLAEAREALGRKVMVLPLHEKDPATGAPSARCTENAASVAARSIGSLNATLTVAVLFT